MRPLASVMLFLLAAVRAGSVDVNEITVRPEEYPRALRNPLKGFRPRRRDGSHEWGTLCRVYIKWNEIENGEADGVDRIRAASDRLWRDVEKHNVKVIPRVYLHWPPDRNYWPADLAPGDYSSARFKRRLVRLVGRLGECWDDDPRVAWVQMGLIGKWGEHHGPAPDAAMQKLLGDAFTKAFRNKLVTVRHSWEFKGYGFGIYWDSWAHSQQMKRHGGGIEKLGARWKTAPMAGEVAYNWGRYKVQPGESPTDTLVDPAHRSFLVDSIRRLHCSNLGWVAEYDARKPGARYGAEEVQKAFGWRFVIDEVRYPARIERGRSFRVSFVVRNTGSAPFYYKWPVELGLLDARTKKPVWRQTFKDLDVRKWLPGDGWNSKEKRYTVAPKAYAARGEFTVPGSLRPGVYVLALAILDPAGMLPSARFAVRNYLQGGRHPIGTVGVGRDAGSTKLDEKMFDDPAKDGTLHYTIDKRARPRR